MLVNAYNNIVGKSEKCWSGLVKSQKDRITKFVGSHKNKLAKIINQFELEIEVPIDILEKITTEPSGYIINKNNISLIEEIDEEKISEDEYDLSEIEIEDFMMISAIDILNLSTKIVPQYNGSLENLQGFTDALKLINNLKVDHEVTVVELIKTKLMSSARMLITVETTIEQIINTLKNSIKGESTEVITAKMMATKQSAKSANAFVKEIKEIKETLPNN